jgi:hypothetical protein
VAESPVETKRVVRNLAVHLSDAEILEYGRRLAQANSDVHNEEERQKQVKTELKSKLEGFELERTRLSSIVSSGRENRDIPCDMVFDYSRLIVEVIRLDTKEVAETRRMTEAEQQRKLFDDRPKEADEQFGGKEASPEQVEQIRQHLQEARADEKITEVAAGVAKLLGLFLTNDDIKAASDDDWKLLETIARGDVALVPLPANAQAIVDRAHIAAEMKAGDQHCTDCGARLTLVAQSLGLVEGFVEGALVGQDCTRKTDNGSMA